MSLRALFLCLCESFLQKDVAISTSFPHLPARLLHCVRNDTLWTQREPALGGLSLKQSYVKRFSRLYHASRIASAEAVIPRSALIGCIRAEDRAVLAHYPGIAAAGTVSAVVVIGSLG